MMTTPPPRLRVIRGHSTSWPFSRDASHERRRTVLLFGQSLQENNWLIGALESNSYSVEHNPSAKGLARLLGSTSASVGLIEVDNSDSGEVFDAVRHLDSRSQRQVLLLGERAAWRFFHQFVEAGVADFIQMPCSASELLLRVELRFRDHQRSLTVCEAVEAATVPEVNPLHCSIGLATSGCRLSEREYQLYGLLAERFGTVISRDEILMRIWERSSNTGPLSNVVDVYVRYLRVKLAAVAPHLSIRTVRGAGYVLEQRVQVCDDPAAIPEPVPMPAVPPQPIKGNLDE